MGFRSVFITEDRGSRELPQWFLDKWGSWWHFYEVDGKPCFPISSKFEQKTYGNRKDSDKMFMDEWHEDLQKTLPDEHSKLILIWLHECGGITRVQIEPKRIVLSVPNGWTHHMDNIGHDYCYGCSDAKCDD